MVADPRDLFVGFGGDIGAEGGVGRRHRSAEHEVLPHHDAHPIGGGVEGVVEIIAAAPDADHIHVRIARRLQQRFGFGRVDAGGEAVERDDVRALGEDGRAVDDEAERTLPAVERHGAQADGARLRVAVEGGGDGVERLRPIADRLPTLRFGHGQRDRDRVFARGKRDGRLAGLAAAVGTGDGGGERDLLAGVGEDGGVRGQARFGLVQRLLRDADMIEAGIVPRLQLDRAPDAVGDEAGTPVPAVLVFGLADIGAGLHALGLVAERAVIFAGQRVRFLQHHRLERLDRAGDRYENLVLARLQQRLRIGTPAAMGVVRGQQRLTVDGDGRERVEPVEHEVEVAVREHLRRDGQRLAVLPCRQARPLDRAFIGADEGIGHALQADQVFLHATRHARGEPARFLRVCLGGGGVGGVEPRLPCAVERHYLTRGKRRGGEQQGQEGALHFEPSVSWTLPTV